MKLHCPRYAIWSSGTGDVLAVAADAVVLSLGLATAVELWMCVSIHLIPQRIDAQSVSEVSLRGP